MLKIKGKSNVITTFPDNIIDEGGNTNKYVISGSIEQTSIPTPTNPVTPIECGDLVTSGEHQGKYQIPINVNGTTSYIYLDEPLRKIGIYSDIVSGTGSVIRRICKYEITGNENVSYAIDGSRCGIKLNRMDEYAHHPGAVVAICSHFKMQPNGTDIANIEDNSAMLYSVYGLDRIWFRYDNAPDSGSSENNILKFLKDQYNAGTPVTIWAATEDEITSTTTAPTLTLINGSNNISINTTLSPSMMRINYNVEKLEESSYTEFPVEYTSNEGSLNSYNIDGNMVQESENLFNIADKTKVADNKYYTSMTLTTSEKSQVVNYVNAHIGQTICFGCNIETTYTGSGVKKELVWYFPNGTSSTLTNKDLVTPVKNITDFELRVRYDTNDSAIGETFQMKNIMFNIGTELLPYCTYNPTPSYPISPIECGDKTENLWNLQETSTTTTISDVMWSITNGTIRGSGTTSSVAGGDAVIVYDGFHRSGNYMVYCAINPSYALKPQAGTYTFNAVVTKDGNSTISLIVGKSGATIQAGTAQRAKPGDSFTTDGEDYVMLVVATDSSHSEYEYSNIMLNEGSTALPYEPYGYRIPIETNKIYLNEPLYGIDSYKDYINGYTGECTRQIKKLVLTGQENWTYESQYTRFYTSFPNSLLLGVRATPAFCTHYQVISDGRPLADTPYNSMYSNSVNRVWFFKTEYTNVENWKTYLAQQYSNGTPVIVWYILETSTTETITLPSNPPSSIKGYLTQSTTPTPTNPVYPTYNGKLKSNNKYEIFNTNGSEIGNTNYIYTKEPIRKIGDYSDVVNEDGSITRYIKKLVLTGEEDWRIWALPSSYSVERFYIKLTNIGTQAGSICSHFPWSTTDTDWEHCRFGGTNLSEFMIYISKTTATTETDFKSYLATQYANGTPVTIWYILKTSTTDTTITTPPTINTNKGLNTININTNLLPSKLTITYPIGEWIETYYNKLINNNITSNELPISFNSDSNSLNSISIKGNMNQVSDNLIPYPYSSNSQLLNGITWTVYNDGRVTASGETDGGTNFYFINTSKNITLKAGTYTLSFQGTKQNNLILRDADNSINIARINGTEEEVTFTINEDSGRCQLYFNTSSAGTTFNIDGYVMLNVGNTALPYQSYNPTPTSPITPSETGDRTENLFDISKVISSANVINQGASLKIITTSSSAGVVANTPNKLKDYCPDLKVGDTVTLSLETTGSQKRIYLNMTGGTWINNETKTITSEMLDAMVVWYASGVSTEAVVSKVMINYGSTPLPYEPYGYRIPVETGYIYLDEPLYSMGSYADELNLETGVVTRYVKKLVFNGTETWQLYDSGGTRFFYTACQSNIQTSNLPNSHGINTMTLSGASPLIRLYDTNSTWVDIAAFTTFLTNQYNAGTPVTAYYVLNTPTTETITIPIPTTGTIKGYLIQNGTPSPSNPIYPIGNGVATENLCPISEFNKPSTYSSQYYIITLDKPLSAGTYTISALITPESGVTQARISFRKTDNTQEQAVNININRVGRSSATVTITNDVKSIYFYGGTVVTDYISISYSDIVLNEGNTPLNTYQPYGYRIPTINTNIYTKEPLRKIGEYSDVLNADGSITRNVGKLILTGTENFGLTGSETELRAILAFSSGEVGICSHYKYGDARNQTEFDLALGEYLRFNAYNIATTKEEYKAWLVSEYDANHPVTIWYALTTPTTETITLPKIPTAIGTNIIDINTTLPPSEVTIETKQWKPTVPKKYNLSLNTWNYDWNTFRELVRSGNAEKVFPIGTILYEEWGNSNSTAYQIIAYNKHFDSKLTALGYTYSVTLCQVFVTYGVPFDCVEAMMYVSTAMPAGDYKFTIPNYDTSYGGNKTYHFHIDNQIPKGGQICLEWRYQTVPRTIRTYSSATSTTALDSYGTSANPLPEWNETDYPDDIDLGTVTYSTTATTNTYGIFNHIHRARYGSNNYYQSRIRQYINGTTNWWSPQTIFDRPTDWNVTTLPTNGLLSSMNADFLNVLATPTVSSVTNQIFEYVSLDGTTFTPSTSATVFNTYDVNDKIFLLSHTEVNLSTNPNIGSVLDYYIDADNTKRIKYDIASTTKSITGDITNVGAVENPVITGPTARYWWFRIPHPSYAHHERNCYPSGALDYSGVCSGYGCVPACVIQ